MTGRSWTRATEARLRWATRLLLEERFGARLRGHDARRPPESDRAAVRAWVARGLGLQAEVHAFAARVHAELDRRAADGPLDVDAMAALLEEARSWPAGEG